MHPSQTREQRSTKTEKKHGQREILESRDNRQVRNKRRVEVQSQNRDLLITDVCTCLAHGCHWRVGAYVSRSARMEESAWFRSCKHRPAAQGLPDLIT